MKNTLLAMFGISVFAGLGYLAWAYTSVGKATLAKWMLKKWKEAADKKEMKQDTEYLAKELKKLDYTDHELLFRYTLFDPLTKDAKGELTGKNLERFNYLLKKIAERKITQRADLSQLDNNVFPG